MLLHSEIWLLLGSDAFTVPDLYCKVNVTLELAGINQSVYLREGSEFGSQLQKRHLCSLRRILGVKNSTTNWAVLRECGQEPSNFSGSVLPSGYLIACLIPTVRLYVVC